MRWKMKLLATGILLAGLVSATAVSAQDANRILARIDSVLKAPRDMTAVQKMTLIDRAGGRKSRTIKIMMKGSELRLIRFLSPADVCGVSFLRIAADRLYLYLPAFRKVRRIAASIKRESFMGTDFSYEDVSQTGYSKDYAAAEAQIQGDRYRVELRPKEGADVGYGKIVLYADTATYVLRKAEFYDRSEKPVKILRTGRVKKIDGYWTPREMEMVTVKTGHKTVLELSEIRFDQGLPDRLFTQRYLKRIK